MRINTNSWHYRLNKKLGGSGWVRPRSLCPYFWGTVAAVVVWVATRIILPAIGIVTCGILLVIAIEAALHSPFRSLLWAVVFVLSALAYASAILAFCFAGDGIRDWFKRRVRLEIIPEEKPAKAPKPIGQKREPGPFWSYLKAVKGRVCPIIEYVSDGEA